MRFLFGQRFRRNTVICLGILITAFLLKFTYPKIGAEIGGWIAGTEDNRVSKAVSCLFSSISEGNSVKEAVEVFCETLQQDSTQD